MTKTTTIHEYLHIVNATAYLDLETDACALDEKWETEKTEGRRGGRSTWVQEGHVEKVNGGECSATIVSRANADKYVDADFSCANRNVGTPQSWIHTESGQSLGCLLQEDDLLLQLGRPPLPLVDVGGASSWIRRKRMVAKARSALCPLAVGRGAPDRMRAGQEDVRCLCTESLRSHKPQ